MDQSLIEALPIGPTAALRFIMGPNAMENRGKLLKLCSMNSAGTMTRFSAHHLDSRRERRPSEDLVFHSI
jgi:hypothetical protein